MSVIVTAHACSRYVERINPRLSLDEARAAIEASNKAIETAIGFGAHVVKLGCGGRLVLDGSRVVTVLSPAQGRDRSMMQLPAYSIVGRV